MNSLVVGIGLVVFGLAVGGIGLATAGMGVGIPIIPIGLYLIWQGYRKMAVENSAQTQELLQKQVPLHETRLGMAAIGGFLVFIGIGASALLIGMPIALYGAYLIYKSIAMEEDSIGLANNPDNGKEIKPESNKIEKNFIINTYNANKAGLIIKNILDEYSKKGMLIGVDIDNISLKMVNHVMDLQPDIFCRKSEFKPNDHVYALCALGMGLELFEGDKDIYSPVLLAFMRLQLEIINNSARYSFNELDELLIGNSMKVTEHLASQMDLKGF